MTRNKTPTNAMFGLWISAPLFCLTSIWSVSSFLFDLLSSPSPERGPDASSFLELARILNAEREGLGALEDNGPEPEEQEEQEEKAEQSSSPPSFSSFSSFSCFSSSSSFT
eukprot:CAMPEP_0181330366 /NCGR_PEP_ID=MMETSP1101-20121128/23860_1 /TAXON_ID=46948 /ORGANISM="Rhodomonas abbreviata, Strain Caron Lab Isolate" /LENGTH=110 /DNA_ID=CAMNT_0023439615 /DNA_START=247 /DNA_END=579 /DNA_ORIENTATION=-